MTTYEQPKKPYAGMPPAAYFALLDHVVIMEDTEKRQALAQSVFTDLDDYTDFMKLVQGTVGLGETKEERLDRRADIRVDNMLIEALAKKKLDKIRRDESGAVESVGIDGATALLGTDDSEVAIWGDGNDILLAEGEAMMLCGPSGVGKTTVINQFLRARLGITDKALGYSVQPTKSKVLYLACDRPRQWERAARRILNHAEYEDALRDKLVVRKGPPPADFAKDTDALLNLCLEEGADTVIIDSLKDVAIGLSNDEVGAAYNQARQKALRNGITVVELHHLVKNGINGNAPNNLQGVYGSVWITGGAGSVVLLWGEAGDEVVRFTHLKQPVNEIGPLDLHHDHATGESSFAEKTDLITLAGHTALTVLMAAKVLFDTEKPSDAQKKKAKRKLDKHVEYGQLKVIGGGIGSAASYVPNTLTEWSPTSALASTPEPAWDAQQLD